MSSAYERELRDMLERVGYVVIRSAGSMGEGDLVAIEPATSIATVIEVKSVKGDRFYSSNTQLGKDQYRHMQEMMSLGVRCCYAVRWKGQRCHHGVDVEDKWDFFRILPDRGYPVLRLGLPTLPSMVQSVAKRGTI